MSDVEELLGYTKTPEDKSVSTFVATPNNSAKASWKRLQEGDKSAASDFLREVDPTITKGVSSFAGGDQAYKTQARLLALEAAKSYDPDRGTDITTHVYNNLKRLQRTSAQRGNLTHVPEKAAMERQQIQRAMREWEADHGNEPTTEDIASVTGLSRKRIDAVMNMRPVAVESMVVTPEGENLVASQDQRALDLYNHAIYDELDDIDKKIYEWSTGYGKGVKLSNKEMAQRLNITPAAVSQRAAKISAKFVEGRELIRRSVYGS